MTSTKSFIVFSLLAVSCLCQRPSYAGRRPIGYPILGETPISTSNDELGDGLVTEVPKTTERIPIEALGDINLVKRLYKIPLDKQPYWFINWKALDEHRNKPQTYPLRPNNYIHRIHKSNDTVGYK
ncbi:unnamed protein product [Parnassius apollo]|uniref:(apollo) hypothetical protein n=1 Tax=Parnassius apollo TaxID=110799 RepID=A0A8S3XHC9_PARAO|nr:unnamed protein product [Parnassius apollo]